MRCGRFLTLALPLPGLLSTPVDAREADGMQVVLVADGRMGGLPPDLGVTLIPQGQNPAQSRFADDGGMAGDVAGNGVGVAYLQIRKAQLAEVEVKVGDRSVLNQRIQLPAEAVAGILVQRVEGSRWQVDLLPGGRVSTGGDVEWAGPPLSERPETPNRAEASRQTSPLWWVWSLAWLGLFGWLSWRALPRTTPLPLVEWTPTSSHRRLWLREVGSPTEPLQVEIHCSHPPLEIGQQALIRSSVRGVPTLILGDVPHLTRVLDHEGAGLMKEGATLHLGPLSTSLEDITHFVRRSFECCQCAAILCQNPTAELRQQLAALKTDGGVLELVWILPPLSIPGDPS